MIFAIGIFLPVSSSFIFSICTLAIALPIVPALHSLKRLSASALDTPRYEATSRGLIPVSALFAIKESARSTKCDEGDKGAVDSLSTTLAPGAKIVLAEELFLEMIGVGP